MKKDTGVEAPVPAKTRRLQKEPNSFSNQKKQLAKIARLGTDYSVPFFIRKTPAVDTGRGKIKKRKAMLVFFVILKNLVVHFA